MGARDVNGNGVGTCKLNNDDTAKRSVHRVRAICDNVAEICPVSTARLCYHAAHCQIWSSRVARHVSLSLSPYPACQNIPGSGSLVESPVEQHLCAHRRWTLS